MFPSAMEEAGLRVDVLEVIALHYAKWKRGRPPRHLLEKHELTKKLFEAINGKQPAAGLMMRAEPRRRR